MFHIFFITSIDLCDQFTHFIQRTFMDLGSKVTCFIAHWHLIYNSISACVRVSPSSIPPLTHPITNQNSPDSSSTNQNALKLGLRMGTTLDVFATVGWRHLFLGLSDKVSEWNLGSLQNSGKFWEYNLAHSQLVKSLLLQYCHVVAHIVVMEFLAVDMDVNITGQSWR